MQLHQLVHTLSYGDAISGEVLALQRCFRSYGWESEIYSINTHPKLKGQARDYRDFSPDFSGEVLLHYSLGSPLNALYRSLSGARRSLIFHNLTPSHWFKGVNPRIVADIDAGAAELPELCGLTDFLIADSKYNAEQLAELGFDAHVLNLPIDPEKWAIEANPGIAAMLKADPALHLVHVGRLAPNKCVEDVIKTFFFLHHKIERNSKLWLVGIDIDTELYSFSLKRMVDEFDLRDAVNFVGCLADSELKALYQSATAYLCMSEHEGFCLPLIEAMYFGLPVLSYSGTALADTLGSGGILFHDKRHPEIAELINKIYREPAFRAGLAEAGHARVRELSFENFEQQVRALFDRGAASEQRAVL